MYSSLASAFIENLFLFFPALFIAFCFSSKNPYKMQNNAFVSPKCPRFFKVILADALTDGKIGIPKRYVQKHGSELLGSNSVLLNLPDGKKWKMGVTKSDDGTIWIDIGWRQFAQHYHLAQGSFLVFQKDVFISCCFEVSIFDLTATEIDYPSPVICNKQLGGKSSKKQGGDHVVGDNIFDSIPLIVYHDSDSDDDDDDGGVSVEFIGEASNPNQNSIVASSLKAGQNCMEENEGGETWGENNIRKGNVVNELQRAKSLKSNNPFFKIDMRPSYANRLAIPAHFARKYASILRSEEKPWLRVASSSVGDNWQVSYNVMFSTNKMQATFRQGWSKFVKDNSLKVEDVCVFEMVCPSKLIFEVTIYRA